MYFAHPIGQSAGVKYRCCELQIPVGAEDLSSLIYQSKFTLSEISIIFFYFLNLSTLFSSFQSESLFSRFEDFDCFFLIM